MKKVVAFLKKSVVFENSALVLMLGLCPLLAVSKSMTDGVLFGICAVFVLVSSGVIISLITKLIPDKIKTAVCMVTVAFFVAVAELLLHAFLPDVFDSLGIYLPLLTVSGIAFKNAETAENALVGTAALTGLATGTGYFALLVVMSFIRELFGNGTLFGMRIVSEDYAALVLLSPAGALLLFGFILALFKKLISYLKEKEEN